MKRQLISVIAGAAVFGSVSGARAQTEELFSYFFEESDPKSAQLVISPCKSEDEVIECVSHSLSCTSEWRSVQFDVIYGPVEKIANALVSGTEGNAQASVKLAGGSTTVDLRIASVHLDANELDGGWSLSLSGFDAEPLLDALTEKSSEGAVLMAGGEQFTLAPRPGDGAKLMRWKQACLSAGN